MSKDKDLKIEDLEPVDTLDEQDLDGVSGGTAVPGVDGKPKPGRRNYNGEILTPTEYGRV